MQFLVQPLPPHAAAGPLYAGNEGRTFVISCAKSGLALTAVGNNVQLQQHTWNENSNQQWKVVPNGDGTFRIQNVANGQMMDVAGAGGQGAQVLVWGWHGGNNQRWRVVEQAQGHFRIDAVHSGLSMDISGGSMDAGAPLITYPWHGGPNQLWILSEVRAKGNLAQSRAVIFQHGSYGGASQTLGLGSYDIADLKVGNDQVSSLKVPPGLRVTLYEHANFRGNRWSFTEDTPWVGDAANDRTSGVVVEQVASIYEHGNYQGLGIKLGVGRYNISWEKIAGSAMEISGAPNGGAWVVNNAGNIYEYNGTNWTQRPGAAKDVGVGSNGTVWVIGTNAVGGGYGIYRWNGSNWDNIPGGAVRIAVDPNGLAWVVNNAGGIYQYTGSGWIQRPGAAYDIGIGADGTVWVIGTNPEGGGYGIYRWNGSNWDKIDGSAVRIAVKPNGKAWVVNNAGNIFEYHDSGWVHVPGGAKDIGVCPDGKVWVIGTNPEGGGFGIYRRMGFGLPNDVLSSLKVPAGLMVTLYEHADFAGDFRTYYEDTPFVNDFNDRASSIIVKQVGVVVPEKVLRFGGSIQLKGVHGKWLVAESDGRLRADRPHAQGWETFTIWRSGATTDNSLVSFGDIISLKSYHGKFVVAESNGDANANRDAIGGWEQFQLIRSGATASTTFLAVGDRISLRSVAHNRYLVAEGDGDANVNRTAIGPWEIFEVTGVSANNSTAEGGSGSSGGGACGAAACGAEACGADACGADACGADACGAAACGVAASLIGVCGAAASGIAVCGADVSGAGACGAAACGAAAAGIAACGADACGAAACGAAACGAAACGAAACGADACGAAACPVAVNPVGACGADAGGIDVCPVDVCGANVCGVNLCPADACAADACALDIIPIIPGI